MKAIINTITQTVIALGVMIGIIWMFLHMDKPNTSIIHEIKGDSIADAKEALKSPVIAGKIAATVEHCKLYQLKTDENEIIYWSICYDSLGRISTALTSNHKQND